MQQPTDPGSTPVSGADAAVGQPAAPADLEIAAPAPERSTPGAPKPGAPKPSVPKPGAPKPGGPKPGARGAVPGASRPPAARPGAPGAAAGTSPNDPGRFGRIDDDGTVWLLVGSQSRQVGSWQAGSPADGLAHFGRRFDDLATEVEILEERLSAGTGDPRKTQSSARALLESLPTAAVIGDVAALETRLTTIIGSADSAADERSRARAQARSAAIARKEALCAEAEQIGAETTAWKQSGDRLRAILDEWKTIKGVDRKTDDVLWKRYAKARDTFNRRRGTHFAELDRERAGARARKDEIIATAQTLAESTEWGPTSGRFRELLAEWKAAGRAPRDQDDALWERFKAVQDQFFAARNAAAAERDDEFEANATAKRELLAEAQASVDPSTGVEAARRALRDVQERWESIGKVPREQMQTLEKGIRAVEKRVRDAEDSHWQRTDPEVAARAQQFAARVAQLEEQAAKARARGRDREADDLSAQAQQWRQWSTAAQNVVSDR